MGIQNLNQHINGRTVSLADLRGMSFAIDGHTFLHKAAQSFARQLLFKGSVVEIANLVAKWVGLFLSVAEHVIMVFDGAYLPAKRPTNEKRAIARRKALEEALSLQGEDQNKILQQSVSFTFEQVREIAEILIRKFSGSNFYSFMAPFEADAQLAFLSYSNVVDVIVTLDSDIYLYAVERVLFNYNFTTNEGKLVENCSNDLFTDLLSLRKCCILSGCDYIGNMKRVGIKRAQDAVLEAKTIIGAFELLLTAKYKDFPEGISAQEYVWRLIEALFVFQYMRVFDPIMDVIVTLNKMDTDKNIYDAVGDIIGEKDVMSNVHQNSAPIKHSIAQLKKNLGERYIGQIACSQIVQHEALDVSLLKNGVLKGASTAAFYKRDARAPGPAREQDQPLPAVFKSIRNATMLE